VSRNLGTVLLLLFDSTLPKATNFTHHWQIFFFSFSTNMLALRWHGNKDLRIDEVPLPELRRGWVKVKNVWAGICGSGKDMITDYSIPTEYMRDG
jgi:hypothetical protein